jgi:molybdate transport system substrate-binding protein
VTFCREIIATQLSVKFVVSFTSKPRQRVHLAAIGYNTPMNLRSLTLALAATAAISAAQNSAVRVLVSNGLKAAMEDLQPQCERAVGHPLAIQFNSTAGVKKKIEAGEGFDVTMITTEAIDDLIKQGKIAGNSRASIGRSELGIGIRTGAAKPDIRTTEALKRALREAKSITYPQDGASRGSRRTSNPKSFWRRGLDRQPKASRLAKRRW